MGRFRGVVLLLALVAVARGQGASNDVLPAGGSQESPAVAASVPEGQVETSWMSTAVRGAEAFLYLSEPNRPDIDDDTRQAIGEALKTNEGNPILWVRLELDVPALTRLVDDFDPSDPRLDSAHLTGGIGPTTPALTPVVLPGKITKKGPIRSLEQNLVFALPPKTSSLSLDMDMPSRFSAGSNGQEPRRLPLAIFSFSRLLLGADEIFPQVRPQSFPFSLTVITSYARKQGMGRIDPNHVRFFNQPKGIVTEAVDIDLVSGKLILYPGTHQTWTQFTTTVEPTDLAALREALASEAFARIPEQGSRSGMDGYSYFIEVDLNGSYLWKLHWSPDDEDFKRIVGQIRSLLPRRPLGR